MSNPDTSCETSTPAVSILICTRNRGAKLRDTLESITRAAALAHLPIEAIVVDNGSTDDTAQIVHAWILSQAFPAKLIYEGRPGLSCARNAGLPEARARIIAMSDDDCVLHPDYFVRLHASFSAETGPAIVGGRIELGNPSDLPITVKTDLSALTLDSKTYPGGFVMGANLAFTADVPALVGQFDEQFGAGARFVAAEDTDFLLRADKKGIPIRYDPSFAVDHFHGRRGQEEAQALARGYNVGDGALYAKHLMIDPRILMWIQWDLKRAIRDIYQSKAPTLGIKRYGQFTLSHRFRGFLDYFKYKVWG